MKKYEPNYEKNNFHDGKLCNCSTTAGIIGGPMSQACRKVQAEEEHDEYDNNHNGYLPVANAIRRRSARFRYPLALSATTTTATTALSSSTSSAMKTSTSEHMLVTSEHSVWSREHHATLRRFLVQHCSWAIGPNRCQSCCPSDRRTLSQ